jgi:hypothetical protein
MCDIPVPVDDQESIVRAILNIHLDEKGKLRANAFRPKPGSQDVSVMRHTHMGSEACRTKAKGIRPGAPNVTYRGLAAIQAGEIRYAGSEVVDSRDGEGHYCGHADITHGIVAPPPGEPASPALMAKLQALRKAARYYADPAPENENWRGAPIT